MAKMKLNPAVNALSGKLGKMVHRQLWGEHVVSQAPDFSDRVLSPKQVAENTKYKTASLIWKGLPEAVRIAYKDWGKRINKPPYALFNKNYSSPPAVEAIDLSQYAGKASQPVTIRAVDLFEVSEVEVTVRQASGVVVEHGPAVRSPSEPRDWIYRTTVTVAGPATLVVEAVAMNWPGKRGNRLELLSVPG